MIVRLRDDVRFDRLFHALADATRRDIVRRALVAEQSISTLAARYPMSFSAVHKHVALLEQAGLVRKRRRGREQLVRGDVENIAHAQTLLDEFEQLWRARVDRFDELIARRD